MDLTLPRFGSQHITVAPESIIDFQNGIPGFEDCKRFALLHEGATPSVYWLQSLDDTDVVFSLADPASLNLDYEVNLNEADEKALQYNEGDDIALSLLLSKADSSGNVSILMKSPIIINASKRTAIQKPLRNLQLGIRAN